MGVGASETEVMAKASTCNDVAPALGSFFAAASPASFGGTGSRHFGTDERGTIFQNTANVALTKTTLVTGETIKPVQ
jgi:hypothetical protein